MAVLPQVVGELARGLLPRMSAESDQWLMLMTLSGIVMSGSTTVFYGAWAEERQMGLFWFSRRTGCFRRCPSGSHRLCVIGLL